MNKLMKNLNKFSLLTPAAILILAVIGCNMSTANLGGLKTSKDKEGKAAASTFKSGETINAAAEVANNPGKVKVKFYLTAESDADGIKKGETLKGSEVSVDIDGDGIASYSVPVSEGIPGGKYKLTAEMINDAGEKKDSKTAEITVENNANSDQPSSYDPPGSDGNEDN